jgi:predicted aminopeptidase
MRFPFSIPGSFIPLVAASLLVLFFSALFSGCYTLKQGAVMLGYLGRAAPLKNLRDSGSAEDREFALRVADIRSFAVGELGLKESKNYTRYVTLDRDYLAAVVSACAKDSFTAHEWWFPVVGTVPYKGFFSVEDARKERTKLERKNLDVWIRGVDAFSTLGWFQDPLYSYMRDYPVEKLANLIIHEQLHATVFLKDRVQFNEELAEFVGTQGARLYMESRFSEAEEMKLRQAGTEADNAAFIEFIRGLITELDGLYKSGIDREEKLRRKEDIIAAAQARFTENYDSLFKSDDYRGFSKLPINNAYLELYRLYYGEKENYFKTLYERSNLDLRGFIAAAKTLKGKGDPREELERALDLK